MQEPTLLKVARESELVVAPTAMEPGADDGLYEQESPPLLLPAAETTLMLLCGGSKEIVRVQVARCGLFLKDSH